MRVMSTKVQMDVEEYLRTSFDGSDCEYLDGEVVERNMGRSPTEICKPTWHTCYGNFARGWESA